MMSKTNLGNLLEGAAVKGADKVGNVVYLDESAFAKRGVNDNIQAGGAGERFQLKSASADRRDAVRMAGIKAELGDEPLHGIEKRYAYRFIKRMFDIAFSDVVLIFLSWLFAIIAIAIKIDDPKGPVFFKQERVGWSIIGQKSGAAREMAPRPVLSALKAWRLRHTCTGLGVAA